MPVLHTDSSRSFQGPHGISHVAEYGNPAHPPAVLLHSGGLSGKQWRRAVSELRDAFFVLVPDGLGMGASPPWDPAQSFHFMQDVEQLIALLETLAAPAHLVGHSYGGLLALRAAHRAPTRVDRLALYEPASFGVLAAAGDPAFADVLDLSERYKRSPRTPEWSEDWLRSFVDFWNSPGAWNALSAEARADYLRIHHKLEREVDTLLADRTSAEELGAIRHDTLLMVGESSPRAARRVVDRLAVALPNAALEVVAHAGHLGPLTHARRVAARIGVHLRARPNTRAPAPDRAPAPPR